MVFTGEGGSFVAVKLLFSAGNFHLNLPQLALSRRCVCVYQRPACAACAINCDRKSRLTAASRRIRSAAVFSTAAVMGRKVEICMRPFFFPPGSFAPLLINVVRISVYTSSQRRGRLLFPARDTSCRRLYVRVCIYTHAYICAALFRVSL